MKYLLYSKLAQSISEIILSILLLTPLLLSSQPNHLVISQVYGGGGNSGATYTHDFVEIFNPTASAVNLNGLSVQYAGATGTTWQVTALGSIMLQPGQYYLIQQAMGAGGTTSLPTPDAIGTIAMAATAGKIALVSSTVALSGSCPTTGVIDFVGFGTTANCFEGSGTTPAPSNTNAIFRAGNGCTDSDNNSTDFSVAPPLPRNTASPINTCSTPVDCVVSEWSEWSDCSAACGGGTQTRTRTVVTPPSGGGVACPELEESRSCNEDPCTTNISDRNSDILGLRVFPNPFSSTISVITTAFPGILDGSFRLLDIQGRELHAGRVITSQQGTALFLPQVPRGVYLLEIKTPEGNQTIKIVKE